MEQSDDSGASSAKYMITNDQLVPAIRTMLTATGQERNEAAEKVRGWVERAVQKLANQNSKFDQDDMISQAFEKILFNDNTKNRLLDASHNSKYLSDLLWTTIRNVIRDYWASQNRRKANAPYSLDDPQQGPIHIADQSDSPLMQASESLDEVTPLCETCLNHVKTWPPMPKITILTLLGVYRRIPSDLWESWILKKELDLPFPPQEFLTENIVSNRNKILSDLLGISPNTLAKNKERGVKLAQQLACCLNSEAKHKLQ